MKVYLVYGDNGLSYSDHDEWVESVHRSRNGAEEAAETYRKKKAGTGYDDRTSRDYTEATFDVVEMELLP